ncbi:MAG: glycosyltransferase, partial [Ignavibacteriaceae bacterium]
MSTINLSNKKIDLSIVIINYNLAKEIESCLSSLLNEIDMPKRIEYEIIIVDNNSPDKGLPETEKNFKRDNIYFYYLDENVGFGKGCNYGFSKTSGK